MPAYRPLQFFLALSLLSPVLIGSLWSQELTATPLRPEGSREGPSDVVSRQILTPPLHGTTTLRFSPDGRHFLVQDASGLFVVSREPLRVVFYADAPDAYLARFSNDSQTVSLLTQQLILATWHLPEGNRLSKRELLLPAGCLDAQLAPGAEWLACFTPELTLDLYRTSDLVRVFSQRINHGLPENAIVPIGLHSESAFAAPFGFAVSNSFAPLANRGLFHIPAAFSPDGNFLLLTYDHNSYRIDLPSFNKTNLPASLRKRDASLFAVQPENRALLADAKGPSSYSIVSLVSGDVLSEMTFPADNFLLATNPRYALGSRAGSNAVSLFDLDHHNSIDVPANLGADVYGDTLALYTPEGELQFYRLGEPQPFRRGRLPLNGLPRLYAALVDPSLSTLAIAVRGSGAVFDVKNGNRLASLAGFSGTILSSPQTAFLLNSAHRAAASVASWTGANSASVGANWRASKMADLFPGGSSFIEYSFHDESGGNIPVMSFRNNISFELRGLDPASGRELWKRAYTRDSPVPYNDPQGGRLVLAWKANSASARNAAKGLSGVRDAYKNQKLKDQDSFFEVLDSLTGAPIGGVLVQFGGGPSSFDSAFSCGDALFLIKDQYRVTLYQLQEGKLLARLSGQHPAVSVAGELFTLDEGGGKLGLYDLRTGARIAERRFSDGIAYAHFSSAGDRLFVLTDHQEAIVLDVKKMFEAPANSATEDH
jgi:hypothetical protein